MNADSSFNLVVSGIFFVYMSREIVQFFANGDPIISLHALNILMLGLLVVYR